MQCPELGDLSIRQAGRALRAREISSVELTRHALSRIDAVDSNLHAFILVTRERALADAARADGALASGRDLGQMHGIPYALKDNYDTAGIATTCHSRLFLDHVPKSDSAVAARLTAGGGVLLGKLATHEFAIGGPSHDLPFPLPRNPWNIEHYAGGSSSGSAVAVAAGMTRLAMGSDTGGSIRTPASFCGVVGLKPTYGRIPTGGVFPLSGTFDHCGPLSRTVEDAALALQATAGYDPLDPASANVPVPDFSVGIGQDLKGLRIGCVPTAFETDPAADPQVREAFDAAVRVLEKLGAVVCEVDLPGEERFEACWTAIMFAEAYAIHERDLERRPSEYGRNAYHRLVRGAAITAADVAEARRLQQELGVEINGRIFSALDALLVPTTLTPAPPLSSFQGDKIPWSTLCNMPFNVTGNPALALPIGFSTQGLPLGAQIVGRLFDEATVLRIGAAYEQSTRFHELTAW